MSKLAKQLKSFKMVALIPSTVDVVTEILYKTKEKFPNGICNIANINSPKQIVISGDSDYVSEVVEQCKFQKIKGIPLNVGAPFHCEFMKPAQNKLIELFDSMVVSDPSIPLISNISAQPVYL